MQKKISDVSISIVEIFCSHSVCVYASLGPGQLGGSVRRSRLRALRRRYVLRDILLWRIATVGRSSTRGAKRMERNGRFGRR